MIGAGIFVALAPAAAAAGSGLLIALAIAAIVAYCNATSSARLAALYPQSGGTYVYGRERLGGFWGYTAGWSFVVGKTASCAAMALTVGIYAWPAHAHVVAVAAVLVLTAVNYAGIEKSALLTRLIVAVVLAVLAAVVVVVLGAGDFDGSQLFGDDRRYPRGTAGCGHFVLRIRRIRPHRHARRGGARPETHDPTGDPDRTRRHTGRLRDRRGGGVGGVGQRRFSSVECPAGRRRARCRPFRPRTRGTCRGGGRGAGVVVVVDPRRFQNDARDGPRSPPATRAGRGAPAVRHPAPRRVGRWAGSSQ